MNKIDAALEALKSYPEYEMIGDYYQKREAVSILKQYGDTIRATLEAAKWRDISTAPKDGTVFLLRTNHKEYPSYYSCFYVPPEKSFDGEVTEWDGHVWVCNDNEKCFLVDEEDYGFSWKPIEPAAKKGASDA